VKSETVAVPPIGEGAEDKFSEVVRGRTQTTQAGRTAEKSGGAGAAGQAGGSGWGSGVVGVRQQALGQEQQPPRVVPPTGVVGTAANA